MVALVLALLLVAPTSPVPDPATARILNSGSTNSASYTISVGRDGWIDIGVRGDVTKKRIAKKLATQLYADLARAGSLAALPHGMCMKSVSFGTRTTIVYNSESSPDLSCAQNAVERALNADANAIANAANIVTHSQFRRVLPGSRVPL